MPDASWGAKGAQGLEETPGEPGGATPRLARRDRADVNGLVLDQQTLTPSPTLYGDNNKPKI